MDESSQDSHAYLDPKVLSKIGALELRARLIVEGFLSGMHHSPHRGLSIEFADHRIYTQGDDLRHVDWKLFGKTDKYYIKEYEQETNINVLLAVDHSESMQYRSSDQLMTKYEYATSLAAAIAYLTLQQHDAVGLALFDRQVTHFLKPSSNTQHWKSLVHELARNTGRGKTSLEPVFAELADRLSGPVLIVLISDLFDEVGTILRGLKQLRYHHHDLIVWNVWDPAELAFPFEGYARFDGLEGAGSMLVDSGSLRARYLEEVSRYQNRLRRGCGHMHIDLAVFNTAESLGAGLASFLAVRSARLRRRSSRVLGRG
ncbi:MAG: DUF58 domain-containing protein [Phycisphaerae bacterium]